MTPRQVAERLGIPHYVLDYESRFRDEVIDDFADAYARGETPIPCIACNQQVKFRDLLEDRARARRRGAGHRPLCPPRRRQRGTGAPSRRRSGARPELFPLRHDARRSSISCASRWAACPRARHARSPQRFDLAVADKPDSQDICFVPGGDYAAVVREAAARGVEPGEIVDLDGRVLGRHDGIVHFTVGQRRGLALGGRDGTDNDPLYVVRLEPKTRRVVVGPRSALGRDRIELYDVNWLGAELPADAALPVQVRVRSSQALRPASIDLRGRHALRQLRRAGNGRIARPGLRGLRCRERQPRPGRRLHPPVFLTDIRAAAY